MFCWHQVCRGYGDPHGCGYGDRNSVPTAARAGTHTTLSTSLVVLCNQALPLANKPSTPSSLCDSFQSYVHREFNRPVNVEFVDVKSAFDSFDCTALWTALRSKGMPYIVLHLITALHENTGARIRVGQKMSPRIFTTSERVAS